MPRPPKWRGLVPKCSKTRTNGEPCRRWSMAGTDPPMCEMHGGRLPNVKRAAAERVQAAREKVASAAESAVDTLTALLDDKDPQVRHKAAETLLSMVIPRLSAAAHLVVDTTGNGDGQPVQSAAQIVRERLDMLRQQQERATVVPSWRSAAPGDLVDMHAVVVDVADVHAEPEEVDDDAFA